MKETTYGIVSRYEFLCNELRQRPVLSVIDVGCGTGSLLTEPLAREFSHISFLGVDDDQTSVSWANQTYQHPNLKFCLGSELKNPQKVDAVIASEVIEHVEDPEGFLLYLRSLLKDEGVLILTLPNGWGPCELSQSTLTFLKITGLFSFMHRFYCWLVKKPRHGARAEVDTLAISPHINFFSFAQLRACLERAGFSIQTYQPRMFLCGFGFDQLLKGETLLRWNTQVAKFLPKFMVSDWMVTARLGDFQPHHRPFARGLMSKWRRWMSEKVAGIRT